MQMVQIHACPHDLEKIRKRVAPFRKVPVRRGVGNK